ncbi:hypothetical protein J7E62_24515 [Variovorax paradoxus]|nr:hypothetical protein [Variovorax paradoxus]
MNLRDIFSKKNKAIKDAQKLLKAAELSVQKARQERDWAESMEIYHQLRVESLREYIARLELLATPTTPATPAAPKITVSTGLKLGADIKDVVGAVNRSAPRAKADKTSRRLPTGGLVEA